MNYFEFFGMTPAFFVDEDQLKKSFYAKSREFHPDFYTLESTEKQEEILKLSGYNNEAYKILSDFHERMKYVLELNNEGNDFEKESLPQDFLMDMMDINEEIVELQAEEDKTGLADIMSRITESEQSMYNKVKPLLETFDYKHIESGVMDKIRDYYLKRKYLLRIKDNLSNFALPEKD
ncbi:MAG: Fe-S protein assembly co-chaperone HscB [Saprospiraceae bacterium]|nr:Fe-S protein assembly co-chaperone HscB [Saprospiraceae bacterium]